MNRARGAISFSFEEFADILRKQEFGNFIGSFVDFGPPKININNNSIDVNYIFDKDRNFDDADIDEEWANNFCESKSIIYEIRYIAVDLPQNDYKELALIKNKFFRSLDAAKAYGTTLTRNSKTYFFNKNDDEYQSNIVEDRMIIIKPIEVH